MFFYWLTAFIFRVFAKIFLRLRVEGLQNLPRKGSFILASNHVSSLDPFVIIAAVPRYIRWVVIYEYYDLWYCRWILRQMRFIRVENSLPKEAFRALLQGEALGIFPEGRRSWDGHLGYPRRGMAALARRTRSSVIPVAVLGTFEALPRTRKLIKLHPVTVRIGPPLLFSEAKAKEDNERVDEKNTREIMQSIANLLRGHFPD